VNRRTLAWLIPFVALLSTKAPLRAPEPAATEVVSLRAATENPESARAPGSRSASVIVSNEKATTRPSRPGEESALPGFRHTSSPIARAHARETGLEDVPEVSRELAIPFYATAPPRSE
jgi:hypothetical protein